MRRMILILAVAACAHASGGSTFSTKNVPWGQSQDKFRAAHPEAEGSATGVSLKGTLAGKPASIEVMFDEQGALNVVNTTTTYPSMDDCMKAFETLKADWGKVAGKPTDADNATVSYATATETIQVQCNPDEEGSPKGMLTESLSKK